MAKTLEISNHSYEPVAPAPLHGGGHLRQLSHDLNNCLMVMSIHCDQMIDDIKDDSLNKSRLTLLQENIQLVVSIVQELTEPHPVNAKRVGLTPTEFLDYLREQCPVLQLMTGQRVTITVNQEILFSTPSSSPPQGYGDRRVLVNHNQLRRALMQLIRNSAEAIESSAEHGNNNINTPRSSTISPAIQFQLELTADGDAWLHIKDNGPGILPEIASKILQDGFSTKSGANRGHGLPAAATLARNWGGRLAFIDNANSPSLGTHFALIFKTDLTSL